MLSELTTSQAQANFAEILHQAQSTPVQISEDGKPVAVVVSFEAYKAIEDFKYSHLAARYQASFTDEAAKSLVDGAAFMEDLISGKYDS